MTNSSCQQNLSVTELFPKGALDYYTAKNMGWEYSQEDYDTWQLAERGGSQGDYRDGVSCNRFCDACVFGLVWCIEIMYQTHVTQAEFSPSSFVFNQY